MAASSLGLSMISDISYVGSLPPSPFLTSLTVDYLALMSQWGSAKLSPPSQREAYCCVRLGKDWVCLGSH